MAYDNWKYSKEYKKATKVEKRILQELDSMLFDVQYARAGSRSEARRAAALTILETIKEAYITHIATKT